MALFTINRKIFNALPSALQQDYVEQQIMNEYPEIEFFTDIAKGLVRSLNNYESWHAQYGTVKRNGLKQVDEDCMVPGFSGWSGYLQIGTIVVCPFDWSTDSEDNFDYSFFLARSIVSREWI